MFDTTPFEKIVAYCKTNKIDSIYEKLLFSKFIEEYNDLKLQQNGQMVTPDQEQTLINTLLSKGSLDKNYNIVKSDIENVLKDKTKIIELKYKAKNSGWAIIINIISTIIYTGLLILFFALAEKDIKPIMQKYFQPSTNVNTVEKP